MKKNNPLLLNALKHIQAGGGKIENVSDKTIDKVFGQIDKELKPLYLESKRNRIAAEKNAKNRIYNK